MNRRTLLTAAGCLSAAAPVAAAHPLGLAPTNRFRAGAAEDWTSRLIARGQDLPADHAV